MQSPAPSMAGLNDPPTLACPPKLGTDTRMMAPVDESTRNTSDSPFVSPATRFGATLSNAMKGELPVLRLITPFFESLLPAVVGNPVTWLTSWKVSPVLFQRKTFVCTP